MDKEMLERVAKAVQKYWMDVGYDPSEENIDLAIAAIKAMLEPTAKMLAVGPDIVGTVVISRKLYTSMIEAILNG